MKTFKVFKAIDAETKFLGSLGLLLFCILVFNNRYLFSTPFYEDSDWAANALQIINAKRGAEIYGNYSRWHFNHPGPFWFYVSAVGEILLHDWLPIFPTPYNSHVFAIALVQVTFLIYFLKVIYDCCRQHLAVFFCLLAFSIHFAMVNSVVHGTVFLSIWPPHTILMPFLCSIVSCSALAIGRIKYLPFVILFGGILVHNHVAQPLFVTTLSIASYLFYLKISAHDFELNRAEKSQKKNYRIAGFIGFCFALPILLDLVVYRGQNLISILAYLSGIHDRKSLLLSVLYVLSFFGYCGHQELLFARLSQSSLLFFAERWYDYAIWVALGTFIFVTLKKEVSASNSSHSETLALVKKILVMTAIGFALSVVWASRQTGEMYNFNGYYIYALPYLILVAFSLLLSVKLKETHPKPWHYSLLLISTALFFSFNTMYYIPASENQRINPIIDSMVDTDLARERGILLYFQHKNWPQAISLALALRRKNIPFYVEGSWAFMFGREFAVNNFEETPALKWDIVPKDSPLQKGKSYREFIGGTLIATEARMDSRRLSHSEPLVSESAKKSP